jgi:hypothetical protein
MVGTPAAETEPLTHAAAAPFSQLVHDVSGCIQGLEMHLYLATQDPGLSRDTAELLENAHHSVEWLGRVAHASREWLLFLRRHGAARRAPVLPRSVVSAVQYWAPGQFEVEAASDGLPVVHGDTAMIAFVLASALRDAAWSSPAGLRFVRAFTTDDGCVAFDAGVRREPEGTRPFPERGAHSWTMGFFYSVVAQQHGGRCEPHRTGSESFVRLVLPAAAAADTAADGPTAVLAEAS